MVRKGPSFLICLFFLIGAYSLPQAADDSTKVPSQTVLIGSNEAEITVEDVMLYLEWLSIQSGVAIADISGARVSQAIIELYALQLVDGDATGTQLYSPGLADWLPEHLLTVNRVKRFIDLSVDKAMSVTDWDSEAREYYAVHLDDFVTPETITIRTLLLRTKSRSMEEALELAQFLVTDRLPEQSFESLVDEYSEDDAGRAAHGLMENVARGETVPSFEEAAFSLLEPGQLSDPVTSEFGVHLIKLLSKSPARTKPFEEVSATIVSDLKRSREADYRKALQNEARSREPAGYRINESAIDALMNSLGHKKLNVPTPPSLNE